MRMLIAEDDALSGAILRSKCVQMEQKFRSAVARAKIGRNCQEDGTIVSLLCATMSAVVRRNLGRAAA
jgi:hypothetical protein